MVSCKKLHILDADIIYIYDYLKDYLVSKLNGIHYTVPLFLD